MRKLMEGAGPGRPGVAGKVGELLETIKAGGWCEQQSSLMRAYAFGILEPGGERHALAVAHCRECPACRAHVAALRGLASVLPLPLISPLALAGASGRGASAASGRAATRGGVRATAARRAALRGWAPARRLLGDMLRVQGMSEAGGASRLGVGGWSGVAGSLTAKLVVTAIVVVAAGYAALGSHAHASPSGRPSHAATTPAPIAASAFLQAPFGLPAKPLFAKTFYVGELESARRARSRQRPTVVARRHRRSTPIHGKSNVEAAAREFGLERASGSVPTQPTASRASSPTGEFGFE